MYKFTIIWHVILIIALLVIAAICITAAWPVSLLLAAISGLVIFDLVYQLRK